MSVDAPQGCQRATAADGGAAPRSRDVPDNVLEWRSAARASATGQLDLAGGNVPDSGPLSGRGVWSYVAFRFAVGCSGLGWQGGKPGADLVSLGNLQRLTEPEGFLPGLACLLVAAKRTQRIAKIPQRLRLAAAVAELSVQGQGLLLVVERLRVASQPLIDDAEVVVGVDLAWPVPGPVGKRQGGLVGQHLVGPVVVDLEEAVQRAGQVGGEACWEGGNQGGGLADRGEQVGPFGLQPVQRRSGVSKAQAVAGPGGVGSGQPLVAGAQQLQGVPGGGGVEPEQPLERGQPLVFGMLLVGVQADQVVELVAARMWALQQLRVDQPLHQRLGGRLGLV